MKRILPCLALIALLSGLSPRAGVLYAAGATQQAAVAQNAPAPNSADYVGSDVCATCHVEQHEIDRFRKVAAQRLQGVALADLDEIDETCLGCHSGTHPNFLRSPHAKAGVSCTSCHSVHAGDTEDKLLKASQPKLCFQCHTDVKPAFDMPFHHKVNEGLVKCSDCHDVHGTFGNNNIKSTADQNAICTKCHMENRGPFVFEHPAVKAEGCLGCHTPHGSQNARLLNVPNVNQLCNQCHSPVSAATVHGMNAGSADRNPCITCHTMIHGSNINPAFIR